MAPHTVAEHKPQDKHFLYKLCTLKSCELLQKSMILKKATTISPKKESESASYGIFCCTDPIFQDPGKNRPKVDFMCSLTPLKVNFS